MPSTIIPWGHPSAQKKWSGVLANDVNRKGFFSRRFESRGQNSLIEVKTELQDDAGDRVSFDLSVRLRQKPTSGDNRVKGKEEHLRFFADEVIIDQIRHSVSAGGRMSRKRTAHDLRRTAKERLGDYWKNYMDELKFVYLSGARGMNPDFTDDPDYDGHAGNPIQAPDAAHLIYGGNANAKGNVTGMDGMTRAVVERAVTYAKMIRATDQQSVELQPVDIDGNAHFVLLMGEYQAHALRMEVGHGSWAEIARAAAAAEGRKSPIFTGGLGMINNVVLHSHGNVITFNDYGSGTDLPAQRALFMGRQAGVIAYGTPRGMRWMWEEDLEDYGNEPTIVAGSIFGFKKTRFNDRDFGVLAIDTYARPVS